MTVEGGAQILVVEDEDGISRAIASILGMRQYAVRVARSSEDAVAAVLAEVPDLLIVDLTLPGEDGFELCRRLRTWLHTPILILSVHADSHDKIRALDLGADDYLTKPFVAGELLARVCALLRRPRALARAEAEGVIEFDNLSIDQTRRRIRRGSTAIHLTPTEFDILTYLARNVNRVITTTMLMQEIWGATNPETPHNLRVHIANIRRKIEVDPATPRFLITEPGIGYSLCK